MVFRKLCQAFGVVLIAIGIWFAATWLIAIFDGEAGILWGLLGIGLNLGIWSGLGLLFLVFDPHDVIRNHYMSFHRLVKPDSRHRSFGERIGVGDEDD